MDIGLFVDVGNLYYNINRKHHKRKLNYQKYIDYVSELGHVVVANAYGSQIRNEATTFIHSIKKMGYTPIYKQEFVRSIRSIDISIDIMKGKYDMVILGSAESVYVPLIHWLQLNNTRIWILACDISEELLRTADISIEIPISMIGGS